LIAEAGERARRELDIPVTTGDFAAGDVAGRLTNQAAPRQGRRVEMSRRYEFAYDIGIIHPMPDVLVGPTADTRDSKGSAGRSPSVQYRRCSAG
jgi:hypothetical protein